MSGNGGARPGAGRKAGGQNANTISVRAEKEAMRELVRRKVAEHLGDMIDAQIALSKGTKYLVTRDKTGKFIRVTAAMAGSFDGTETVEVWEKEASVQAFADLMNRAADKPIEPVELTGEDKGPLTLKWQD
jgi:hypothetical protein